MIRINRELFLGLSFKLPIYELLSIFCLRIWSIIFPATSAACISQMSVTLRYFEAIYELTVFEGYTYPLEPSLLNESNEDLTQPLMGDPRY